MKCPLTWLAGAGVLCLTVTAAFCGPDPVDPCAPTKAKSSVQALDATALAAHIDALIAAKWAKTGVKPAPLTDDTQFLRRINLDLAGRIPDVEWVDEFFKDRSADKRRREVDRLLDSPRYVKHFTDVWRSVFLPQANNQQVQPLVPGFEAWLRERLAQNTPYNDMVQELLTVTAGMAMQRGPQRRGMNAYETTPIAFYQANEAKPENLAASTSRLFLGIKLECAQCHDHPHANWTRKQFWEFAAFFAGVQPRGPAEAMMGFQEMPELRALKIPRSGETVLAHFLDGSEPRWQSGMSSRKTLANWITTPGNPYFARAAVNRIWAQLFGLGLVEPIDEMNEDNPPSHPELLDELAQQLVLHRYDLKYLIRAITSSQTYQRSSFAKPGGEEELRLFARMPVRGMTPEQLFDSLVEATRYREREAPRNTPFGPDPLSSPRALFLAKFAGQEKRTEYQTSILQALTLMNGNFIADATSVDKERSQTLVAVLTFPKYDTSDKRIEWLFKAALSRLPRPEETARLVRYVDSGGPKKNSEAALTDVFWALLNSSEFMLNH
jgi:hypothetical protein